MGIYFGSDFLTTVSYYHFCWFRGRYRAGKTLGAVATAFWLQDAGFVDEIWSNIPIAEAVGPHVPVEVKEDGSFQVATKWRVAIVYDESHLELDARNFASNETRAWGAYLGKRDIFLLLPSVYAVDLRFKGVWVEVEYHLDAFGIPLWLYRWGVDVGYAQNTGRFFLGPHGYFDTFDTLYQPSSSAGILEVLRQGMEVDTQVSNPNGKIGLLHPPSVRKGILPLAEGSWYSLSRGSDDVEVSEAVESGVVVSTGYDVGELDGYQR